MKKFLEIFIEILSKIFAVPKTEAQLPTTPPLPPKSEVPTREEVENFPGKIADFKFADISHWEEKFDPLKYKYRLLLNKCTDGTSYVDATHFKRKEQCENNGLIYGGYHFYQCYKDPIKQAAHYVKTHGSFAMPPIMDYEKDGDQNENDLLSDIENAFTFMIEVERLTGITPMFYSYRSMIMQLNLSKKWARFPLWIARYNNVLGSTPAPWIDEKVFAWQYAEDAKFDGIGECDGNVYYGNNNILKLKQ